MPRVSDAHLAARREQIIEAATRCFARNGFHATSMQDVIREAGLSVGAVYRYFKSKDELRWAIAERTVGRIGGRLTELARSEPALPVEAVMAQAVDFVEPLAGPYGVANIAVQVWAESLRDPQLAEFVRGAYDQIRGAYQLAARRARDAGHLPPETDTDALGLALFTLMPGYLLQRVLTGAPDRDAMLAAIRAILETRVAPSSP